MLFILLSINIYLSISISILILIIHQQNYQIYKKSSKKILQMMSSSLNPLFKVADPLQKQKQFNIQRIVAPQVKPKPINVSLTSNPFLRDHQDFQYLNYMLNQYNKRVVFTTKGINLDSGKQKPQKQMERVTDRYQIMSYERLHTLLSDLSQMQSKQDQISKLKKLAEWFRQQDNLIFQRKDQGDIRYRVDKQWRTWQREQQAKEKIKQEGSNDAVDEGNPENIKNSKHKKEEIPSELVARLMGPYWVNSRTIHKELESPDKRLQYYKRKIINIAPFIEKQEQTRTQARILYPKPAKILEPKEDQLNQNALQGEHAENPEGGQQKNQNAQAGQSAQNGQPKQEPNDQQQDLGGFGQEKQQGGQDDQPGEEQQVEDKLAPKNKIYSAAITPPSQKKRKYYKAPYLYYKGEQTPSERSMEMRYVKMQQDKLQKQKEENQIIQLAHQWGKGKSKIDKELQKKLEEMAFKPKYSLANEQPPKIQRLNPQDQAKYGLTISVKRSSLPINRQIDLSNNSFLPSIDSTQSQRVTQRSIKKDRLKCLKNKFSKMLNFSEYEQRETVPSMCQYTPRRRDFSQIIKAHSKSKERLNQLEQVTRLKEKMTRGKLGVNMQALSMGLVLPQDQDHPSSLVFPSKQLLNNPFWVEPAKKGKKK